MVLVILKASCDAEFKACISDGCSTILLCINHIPCTYWYSVCQETSKPPQEQFRSCNFPQLCAGHLYAVCNTLYKKHLKVYASDEKETCFYSHCPGPPRRRSQIKSNRTTGNMASHQKTPLISQIHGFHPVKFGIFFLSFLVLPF